MRNLAIRTVSGAIYVLLVSASILGGPYSFLTVFALITGLSLWEFYRMLEKNTDIRIDKMVATMAGVWLFLSCFAGFSGILPMRYMALWFVFMLYLLIRELFSGDSNAFRDLVYTFFGQLYIALPLSFMTRMGFQPDAYGTNQYVYVYLMSFFALLWVYDTGAYLVGSLLGKHKLMERISPKKSWEGFIGGLVLALLSSVIIHYFFPTTMGLFQWLGFALIIVVFGTWGDLVESMMKRSVQVKDSGNLIPGHGGILDRLDSCLLAAPAAVLYLLFFV